MKKEDRKETIAFIVGAVVVAAGFMTIFPSIFMDRFDPVGDMLCLVGSGLILAGFFTCAGSFLSSIIRITKDMRGE